MARARTPRLHGIESQCSRFDAVRGFQPYPGAIRSRHQRLPCGKPFPSISLSGREESADTRGEIADHVAATLSLPA